MNVEIINRIRSNLAAGNTQAKFSPVSEDALETAEATLGFKIPPLLRLIYANVANGGFARDTASSALREDMFRTWEHWSKPTTKLREG